MNKPPKSWPTLSRHFILLILFSFLLVILGSFKILSINNQKSPSPTPESITTNKTISEIQALDFVSNQKEVQEYLKKVPNAKIQIDQFDEKTNSYMIQVFEIKNGHTNTFNWYEVARESGEVRPMFP